MKISDILKTIRFSWQSFSNIRLVYTYTAVVSTCFLSLLKTVLIKGKYFANTNTYSVAKN